MRQGKKLDDYTINQILKRTKEGVSTSDIAKIHGIARDTVAGVIKKFKDNNELGSKKAVRDMRDRRSGASDLSPSSHEKNIS